MRMKDDGPPRDTRVGGLQKGHYFLENNNKVKI